MQSRCFSGSTCITDMLKIKLGPNKGQFRNILLKTKILLKMKQRVQTSNLASERDLVIAHLFVDYLSNSTEQLDDAFTQWIALHRAKLDRRSSEGDQTTRQVLTLSQEAKQRWLAARFGELKMSCTIEFADARRWNIEYERTLKKGARWQQYSLAAQSKLPPQVEWAMRRIASKQLRIAGAFQKESQIAHAAAEQFREPLLVLKKALQDSQPDSQ